MKYSNCTENYFQNIIKNSWTWNRLTEDEKNRFIHLNFSEIKGTEKN